MKKSLILALTFACSMFAQGGGRAGGTATVTSDLNRVYNGAKNNLLKVADAMPDDSFSFRPNPEEMTFGGWVAHIADANSGACSAIATGERKTVGAAQKTSKADLIAALKASFDSCDAVVAGLTDANAMELVPGFGGQMPRISALYGLVIHSNECYGSMAVYLRAKGIVPPSTAARKGGGKKE